MTGTPGKYQFLPPLRTEELKALEADILARGVLVPVEVDEAGDTLDGHYRRSIAEKHGLPFKTVTRRFKTEAEKQEHAIKLNLARRHLEPWQWGEAFGKLLEVRGVKCKPRTRNDLTGATMAQVAKETGVPIDTAKKRLRAASKKRKLPKAKQRAVEQGKVSLAEAVREEAKNTTPDRKTLPLPSGVFDLILADPPWKYDFAKTSNRKVENNYPTMDVNDLCKLPIPAAKTCVLFLWATAPKLQEALQLIKAWGFSYKTHAVWDKQKQGMGYWFRGQHELLLVATRGKASPPAESKRKPSIFSYPRRKHSEKPAEVYEMLESMFPKATRCELFARSDRKGWTSWGNEVQE